MTTDLRITEEMVEAGAKALAGYDWNPCVNDRDMWRAEARDVLTAALAPAKPDAAGWQGPATIPYVPSGSERNFIAAVRRAHNGNVYTFPATYLNAYPLRFEYGCPKGDGCDGAGCDDGCPTTGWYDATGDSDNGLTYTPIHMDDGDEFLGWCRLPAWGGALPTPPEGKEG